MSIFNTDLSKSAAEDAIEDVKKGKPKSHYRALRQVKIWLYGNLALNSYNQTYNRIYDKYQEHQANIYSPVHLPKLTQGTSMSSNPSFAHQAELLQHLKSFLGEFQEKLLLISERYQHKVDQLHGEHGLMEETYQDFLEYQLTPTRAKIKQLVEHIECNDIPAVKKEIDFLEQRLK